ncbi:MAG: hypothetical protein JXX29_18170 [Deltaproteobacteria bacterium]|nr:hypothetical protein [Deltaproteobacteria bacterium]MBN2673611.1 hypothetical protein [Deltaproteobacteria bacterium]
MKQTIFVIALFAATQVSGVVLAETVQQACDAKKAAVSKLESDKAAKDAEVDAIDKKIKSLQDELKELTTSKVVKKKESAELKGEIAKAERQAQRACVMVELCNGNKEKLSKLKQELEELKKEMASLLKEISDKTAAVALLQQKVSGYERAYTQLKCSELVDGETAQSTIDQCNTIFTSWNANQAEINKLNTELGQAKGAASRIRGKAMGVATKAKMLGKQLEKTCEGDNAAQEAETLEKLDIGADAAITKITTAKDNLKTVKKIRILKPKVKKARKGKGAGDGKKAVKKDATPPAKGVQKK